MNKKGFVFLESVVVLVVVAISLSAFLTTYTVLSNKSKANEYYDKTSDKYLLYAISSLGTTGIYNLNTTGIDDFYATKDNCYSTYLSNLYTSQTECSNMFEDSGLVYLYYVNNVTTALSYFNNPTAHYDNGTIDYMQTLKRNKNGEPIVYLIGVFKRDGHNYYASLIVNDGSGTTNYSGTMEMTE